MSKYVQSFFASFVALYDAATDSDLIRLQIMEDISEMRATLTPPQYAAECIAVFGTGGQNTADGWQAGELRTMLVDAGYMHGSSKPSKAEAEAGAERDHAAGIVNDTLNRARRIARAAGADPAFSLDCAFNAAYQVAKKAAVNAATTKRGGKAKPVPTGGMSKDEIKATVTECFRQDADAVLAAIETAMVSILKEPLRAKTIHAIADELRSKAAS